MSIEVQRQIKENSTELQDFLHDLMSWEHTVKEKEKKLVSGGASKTVPSVRGQKQSSVEKEDSVSDDTRRTRKQLQLILMTILGTSGTVLTW